MLNKKVLLPFRMALFLGLLPLFGFQQPPKTGPGDLDLSASPMRPYIEAFTLDRTNLMRYYTMELDPARNPRMKRFFTEWRERLARLDFNSLPQDGKVDYVVFRNYLDHQLQQLDFTAKSQAETAPYMPFASIIVELEESRKKTTPFKPQQAAAKLTELAAEIEKARRMVEQQIRAANGQENVQQRKVIGNRAAGEVASLRATLRSWQGFYDNYDPLFTWWADAPYKTADAALQSYSAFLRERIAGLRAVSEAVAAPVPNSGGGGGGGRGQGGGAGRGGAGPVGTAGARAGATDDIVGNPIGRDALMSELAFEMIPYTPGRTDCHCQ